MKTLMGQSGIPRRFLDADMSNFQEKYEIGSSDRGFFIHGPRGVGKTHFLAAICKEILVKDLKSQKSEYLAQKKTDGDGMPRRLDFEYEYPNLPAFIPVPELLFRIKQSYSKNSNTSEAEILQKYSHVKTLILDDLGAERATEWSVPLIYLLINRRYSDVKQTFISSNLSLDQIAKQLDDRIASRISGMCDVIEIGGKDKRITGENS